MGVGMAGIGPLAFGLAAGQASADRRGGAFGVVFSARTFAVAVGGMIGGALYDEVGARGVMLLAGVLLVGTLVVFRGAVSARAVAAE
jgi:MFS family permease